MKDAHASLELNLGHLDKHKSNFEFCFEQDKNIILPAYAGGN